MLTIHPIVPLWALSLIFLPLLVIAVMAMVQAKGRRLDWLRRLLMIVLLIIIGLRPVTVEETISSERMNANVIFVVDRTGSMNAEDYNGTSPRIEGVKQDMLQIMEMTKGSRYAILSFDSTASAQLPMTTDAGAVKAWIDTMRTETTAYSKGSNVDRPRAALQRLINETKTEDPESHIIVYFMSDGENTDEKESEPFTAMAQSIDAGAVLGYGTTGGGPMKAVGGDSDGQYIEDPSGGRGLSKLDAGNLERIASELSVRYENRTKPGVSLESTMNGLKLTLIPAKEEQATPSFDDWYWIASILLCLVAVWELVALTLRFPRPVERSDIASMGRQ